MADFLSTLLVVLGALACVAFFVGMVFAVQALMARTSGWATLAQHYRASQPFSGRRRRMQSGYLGGVSFRGILTLGADAGGLYLGLFFPFRLYHPALYIPWDEVSWQNYQGMFGVRWVRLRFAVAPLACLELLERQARVLADAAGRPLPQSRPET